MDFHPLPDFARTGLAYSIWAPGLIEQATSHFQAEHKTGQWQSWYQEARHDALENGSSDNYWSGFSCADRVFDLCCYVSQTPDYRQTKLVVLVYECFNHSAYEGVSTRCDNEIYLEV